MKRKGSQTMDNLEKLKTLADYFNSIGYLYDGLLALANRVNMFCADEQSGLLDRDFAREVIWTGLEKLKRKTQGTPPPYPVQMDEYGGGHEEGASTMPEESGENEMRRFSRIADESWMQLSCDLMQMEADLFGGKEVWITGESAFELLQLEAKNSARLEIFPQCKSRLAAWNAKVHERIANAADKLAAAAKHSQLKAEGAREAEAAARERAENRERETERENFDLRKEIADNPQKTRNIYPHSTIFKACQAFREALQANETLEKPRTKEQVAESVLAELGMRTGHFATHFYSKIYPDWLESTHPAKK